MRGIKVRIYPTASQEAYYHRTFGCCRFVYNTLLARSIEEYEQYKSGLTNVKPSVSQVSFTGAVTDLKKEYPWLNDVPMEALQQVARDLGTAFSNFFQAKGKVGYPTFKKKFRKDSFRLMDRYFSIRDGRLITSKLNGSVKVKWDPRGIPNEPSRCTISRDRSGRWFATFLDKEDRIRKCGHGSIGIDLGLKDLLVTSAGEVVKNPRHFNRNLKKLQRLSRQHAKKVKGSRNRERSRIKLAKHHAKIADTRKDFLQQLTTRLINENQVICLELLNPSGMVRNRKLARHIADAGWSMFSNMLMYKAQESTASIIFVDRFYPSTQSCSCCGYRLTGNGKLTLKDRVWTCPSCETVHDRDFNAATNILNEGLRIGAPPPGGILFVDGH